jgi:hypothetical protein
MSTPRVNAQVLPAPFTYPGWPPASSLPDRPKVTALFKGLIAFGYHRDNKRAEIVFNDGDQRHNLMISAEEDEVEVKRFTDATSIRLGVEGQPVGVYYLRQGSPSDFGYLVDLNDGRFYPNNMPRESFGVKMIVTQGTFYTQKITRYRLSKVTVPLGGFPFPALDPRDLGHLAEHVGIAFDLAASQKVSLTVNGETTTFPTQPGKQTLITFDNECKEDGKRCKHSPGSLFESLRNDFHYHRDVLGLSPLVFRYGLQVTRGELTREGLDPVTGEKPASNDEAPCSGAGYGGSNGLPPPTKTSAAG